MYEMIWGCSTVSVLDSEALEGADKLFVEVLKDIDEQLIAAIDGESPDWEDNLLPYDAASIEEETKSMLYYNLLTGRMRNLAEDRVHAIRDGRSIVSYMEALQSGEEDRDIIKAKIDAELKAAKDSGLNFNVLCNIWLCK